MLFNKYREVSKIVYTNVNKNKFKNKIETKIAKKRRCKVNKLTNIEPIPLFVLID